MLARDDAGVFARTVALALVLAVVGGVAVPAAAAGSSGDASVVARYPANGTMAETTVVSPADVADVSAPRESRTGAWVVPVTLTEAGASSFADDLVAAGFTSDAGVSNCPASASRNDRGYCLLTVVDGDVVYSAALSRGLAESVDSGEFEQRRQFVLVASNRTSAERVAAAFGATSSSNESPVASSANADGATTNGTMTANGGVAGSTPGFGASGAAVGFVVAAFAVLARERSTR